MSQAAVALPTTATHRPAPPHPAYPRNVSLCSLAYRGFTLDYLASGETHAVEITRHCRPDLTAREVALWKPAAWHRAFCRVDAIMAANPDLPEADPPEPTADDVDSIRPDPDGNHANRVHALSIALVPPLFPPQYPCHHDFAYPRHSHSRRRGR